MEVCPLFSVLFFVVNALTHFHSFLAELVEGGTVDRGEVESVAGYFRMY